MKSVKYNMYLEARRLNNITYNNSSYVKEHRPIAVRSYYMSRFTESTDMKFKLFVLNSITENFKVERVIRVILNEL